MLDLAQYDFPSQFQDLSLFLEAIDSSEFTKDLFEANKELLRIEGLLSLISESSKHCVFDPNLHHLAALTPPLQKAAGADKAP